MVRHPSDRVVGAWKGHAYFEGVSASADAEFLVVRQTAHWDGVGIVVAGVQGELAFDLAGC